MCEEIYYLDEGMDNSDTTALSTFKDCLITNSCRFNNLNKATQLFIKEYEKQIELIKRKGSRKEKLSYLKAKMKNKEPIRKQVYKIINERIKL